MIRPIMLGVALMGAASVMAQEDAAGLHGKRSNSQTGRLAVIWDAAEERMARQADAWFKDGDYPRVIQLLRFRGELYPDDEEANSDLGWMLENVEEEGEALKVYQTFRRRNPQNPDGPWLEASYRFRKKDYAPIPALLEPTIAKEPHPNSYRTLAHAYERTSRLADSERIWVTYLARFPDDETAKANLRRVREKRAKAGG
ncbi:MAG TPA: hypothetical protein PLH94_14445 [Fimbriimonadaceae bacterium]|mgnify:CR=1 FL=1|nr:hypothetical protein [Fimbriimonadaceae bacterium]